jgi:FdhD protein
VSDASSEIPVLRFEGAQVLAGRDSVAREEPLEIRLGAVPLAVVMRTPGHDRELALGFLVTERVIRGPDDVVSVRHCRVAPDADAADNVIQAVLAPGVEVDLERLRRNLYASSSCGLCGKATIEHALAEAPPLVDASRFTPEFFYALPERLAAVQAVFQLTGGLHAAGLFDAGGALRVAREDVGRHNAVDKVVGWALERGQIPLSGHALLVSGRVSVEIVQKALAAGVPALAAVSAPSSLAVELAERAGITLVAFLRGRGFNVYAGAERVVASPGRPAAGARSERQASGDREG